MLRQHTLDEGFATRLIRHIRRRSPRRIRRLAQCVSPAQSLRLRSDRRCKPARRISECVGNGRSNPDAAPVTTVILSWSEKVIFGRGIAPGLAFPRGQHIAFADSPGPAVPCSPFQSTPNSVAARKARGLIAVLSEATTGGRDFSSGAGSSGANRFNRRHRCFADDAGGCGAL